MKAIQKSWINKDFLQKLQTKTIRRKELERLLTRIEWALDWNPLAIKLLTERKPIMQPQIYFDEQWNYFEVIWLLENQLNYHWKKFDEWYQWTIEKIKYYMTWLNNYIKNTCWLRHASIKHLKNFNPNNYQQWTL